MSDTATPQNADEYPTQDQISDESLESVAGGSVVLGFPRIGIPLDPIVKPTIEPWPGDCCPKPTVMPFPGTDTKTYP